MKKVVLHLLLLLFTFTTWGKLKSNEDSDILFVKNHLSFNVSFPILFVDHVTHTGLGHVDLQMRPGGLLGLNYHYNFNNFIGLTFGTVAGFHIFKYEVKAFAENFTIPTDLESQRVNVVPFISLPFSIIPRIPISKKSMLSADVGASLNFFNPGTVVQSMGFKNNMGNEDVFVMKLQYPDKPLIDLHFGLNYGIVLKNRNILELGFRYNLGFKNIFEGRYSFHNDDMMVGTGVIASKNNYLAIRLNYIFTRTSGLIKK